MTTPAASIQVAQRAAGARATGTLAFAATLFLFGGMVANRPVQAAPATVAPGKTLRICADPNDLPFSNKAQDGFENKLASLAANALGEPVQYEWLQGAALQRGLAEHACDVIMGWPTQGAGKMLATEPYYRSTYVLVYRQSAPYKIHSLKSPVLKKLSIGVREIGDQWTSLPGGAMLAKHDLQGSARPYPLRQKDGQSPSLDLIKAVANGDLDAAIAWGPPAGYFAQRQPVKLAVVPLTQAQIRMPIRFSISMAVRADDPSLQAKLNQFLKQHHQAIQALLTRYNVPLLPLDVGSDATAAATE